ncbi:glycolate oxidase [Micractinium conductrix]|uniref:Glycolate oxidase n=1 Tax=Micractinium conductrix TaxID=554055 RepID=A0A2P6VNJ4_9CHLO|nr:glycolate oxidase [Micractinium conductrix]|eukprot:PSC75666.1 glycolate oxidase [Micractinium conductrix]
MAARVAVLFILLAGAGAVLGQPSRAQLCTSLAAPLPKACKSTLAKWSLVSETLPRQDVIVQLLDENPQAKPSQGCCNAVEKFDAPGCPCEVELPRQLAAEPSRIQATSEGLRGLAWIASVGCTPQFEATQCEERTLVEPVKTVVEELPARTGTDEPTRAG